jgi:hypothetical protein
LDLKRAEVRPVSRKLAEQVILKYEWLGTMSTTTLHYGLFFGAYCAGVTCIGLGASMAGTEHHRQFGIGRGELLTLARGACVHWAPPGANSKLVSWTCRLLAKARTGRLIWATSDSDAGEVGTIYQACGWTYIGPSSRPGEAEIVAPNGRAFNSRNITSWAKDRRTTFSAMREALLTAGWRFQPSNPKHRYVCILGRADKALVERVEAMRRPYPKRCVGSADSGMPTAQVGGDGATPIPTLSESAGNNG